MDEIELYLEECKEMMNKALHHFKIELGKIRAGRSDVTMLDSVMVNYYDNLTPLNQTATVTAPDARTLFVKPWEKNTIPEIEKAIINSGLGLNPQNDGEQVIINIPQLTEERRIQLVKQAKSAGEYCKVSIRNSRKEVNDELKKLLKEGISEDEIKTAENKVQSFTDEFSRNVDDILVQKEKDILTI